MIAKVYYKPPSEEVAFVEYDVWEIEGLVLKFTAMQPLKITLFPLDAIKKVVMANEKQTS